MKATIKVLKCGRPAWISLPLCPLILENNVVPLTLNSLIIIIIIIIIKFISALSHITEIS